MFYNTIDVRKIEHIHMFLFMFICFCFSALWNLKAQSFVIETKWNFLIFGNFELFPLFPYKSYLIKALSVRVYVWTQSAKAWDLDAIFFLFKRQTYVHIMKISHKIDQLVYSNNLKDENNFIIFIVNSIINDRYYFLVWFLRAITLNYFPDPVYDLS